MRLFGLLMLGLVCAGCGGAPGATSLVRAPSESGSFDSSARAGLGVATLVLDDSDGSVARAMSGFARADRVLGEASARAFEAAGFRVLEAPPELLAVAIEDLERRAPDGLRWIDPTGAWTLLVRGRSEPGRTDIGAGGAVGGGERFSLGLASRVWLGAGVDGRAGVRVEVRPVKTDPGSISGGFEAVEGPVGDWWLDDGASLVIVPAGLSEVFVGMDEGDGGDGLPDLEGFGRASYEGTLGERMLAGHAGGEVVARVVLVLQASSPDRLRLAGAGSAASSGGGR